MASLSAALRLSPYRTTVIEQLYQVALGPTGAAYYAKRFETFQALGRSRPTWNWAAASCTLGWLAYRKLWAVAALYAALVPGLVLLWLAVLRPLLAVPLPIEIGLGLMLLIFSCAIPGLWGDALVYSDVHQHTMRALELAPTLEQARTQLEQRAPNKRHQFLIAAAYIAVAALLLAAVFARPKAPVQIVTPVQHQGLEVAQEGASAPEQPASQFTSPLPGAAASAPTATSNVNAAGTTLEPRVLTANSKIADSEIATESTALPPQQEPDTSEAELSAIPVPDVAPPPPSAAAPVLAATAPTIAPSTAALAAGAVTTAAVLAAKAHGRTKKEKIKEKEKAKEKTKEKTKEKAREKEKEKSKNKDSIKSKESKESKELTKKENKPLTKAQARAQVREHEKAKAKEKIKEKAKEKAQLPTTTKAAPSAAGAVAQTLQAQRYYINVGTFSSAANAKQTQQRLQRAGMPVVVQSTTTNKGERVRVRTGPFDKEESDRNAQRLRSMGLEAVVFQTR